jgi:hypothetical protein
MADNQPAMAKSKAKTDAPAEPDTLVRQAAGTYRSGDDRFEVRQADAGWFLVDSAQSNEFGQELIHGPFSTLKAVREAIPGARGTTTRPLPKPARAKPKARAKAEKPEPPMPTWIDELPVAEARAVRRLIAALEDEGNGDAEALVRRDRDGLLPAIATRRIERRLTDAVEELPEEERAAATKLVRRVAEILSAEGAPNAALPGWTLVEIGLGEQPPRQRRIDLRA